ncbi:hypothetical protein JNUCC64_15325 [Streptomyces sp. JNUCC 64]
MTPPTPHEEPGGGPRPQPRLLLRPWRRTLTFLATAVALGLVAGTCAGYLIQADRTPAPLPPLSQPVVPTAPPGDHALADPADRTDGDLRELLLAKPRGAREVRAPGWVGLDENLLRYRDPPARLGTLIQHEFRRSVAVQWVIDGRHVSIQLDQYHNGRTHGLPRILGFYTPRASDIPGSGNGVVYSGKEPDASRKYLSESLAWRGDVSMYIWITDDTPVPEKEIRELARRQVARL